MFGLWFSRPVMTCLFVCSYVILLFVDNDEIFYLLPFFFLFCFAVYDGGTAFFIYRIVCFFFVVDYGEALFFVSAFLLSLLKK